MIGMTLRIRYLRELRGMTQAELADASGMSRSQLAMIEAETRPANTLRLSAIATALGVPTDQLFTADAADDGALADLLRRLSPEDRAALVRVAEAMVAKIETQPK